MLVLTAGFCSTIIATVPIAVLWNLFFAYTLINDMVVLLR